MRAKTVLATHPRCAGANNASRKPCAGFVVTMVLVSQVVLLQDVVAARPNIVIILADDMGYSDIGCYGGEINTPNLNALAETGLRFTQFYNTGRCCPTRASLLTGLYPHQAGVGHMMSDRGLDGYRGDLNGNCVTIAEVLGPAGYATYMAGKWHVTKRPKPRDDRDKYNWPRQRGFDRFFGTIHGAGSYYDPNSLTRDNTLIAPGSDDFFYTDAISDHAAKFIEEHETSKPFFLYVAFTAPHWPMHARPHNIAKYRGVYDQGWDAIREGRRKRMIEMGLIDPSWLLTPRDKRVPAWEDCELKEWNIRCMEVYAAMVDCLDQGVGRIVDALRQTGQYENTLLFFLADNGGCAEGMGRGGEFQPRPTDPSKLKPMRPGALQYDMVPKTTRDGYPVRQGRGVMPGPADTFVAYGLPWANASNTPFREYKHWVHEGGISSPLIVHWPSGIDRGLHHQLVREPGHLIDLMATCVDVSEADYPSQRDGKSITPMQGVSLRPSFVGQPLGRPEPIYFEHEGNRAVRDGRWKLVAKGANGPWELYDMEKDRTELNNLASSMPDRVQALAAGWERWAVRAHVKPWPYGQKARAKTRITFQKRQLDTKFRSEGVAVGDFNHDGRLDIAANSVYYAGPDWQMVCIQEKPLEYDPRGYANSFVNFADDLNHDGWTDLMVVDFPGQQTWWFENARGAGGPWKRHVVTPVTNNESPQFVDVDGDGRRELLAGVNPDANQPDGPERRMAILRPTGQPDQPWSIRTISAAGAPGTRKYSHGLGRGDLNGDGRPDVLVTEGWWEAPPDGNRPEWQFHPAPFGEPAAHMHVYDFDGDGDADVLSSSAHNYGIWWHEQTADGWRTHTIEDNFSQTHSLCLADINGDGLMDFVTGKRWWAHGGKDPGGNEPAVMCWFELTRRNGRPVWIRHQFDHDSGVGTQFDVVDVNGDGLLDVVSSNKKGVFYFEQIRKE